MAKTLVTIGYHYGELGWGEDVRSKYMKIKDGKDIFFHEIKNSFYKTGELCPVTEKEVQDIIDINGFELLIDVHCGVDDTEDGVLKLWYYGMDQRIIEKVSLFDDYVEVGDWRRMPDRALVKIWRYKGIPSALTDAFFSKEEFLNKGKIYQRSLEKTLKFIDELYELHKQ